MVTLGSGAEERNARWAHSRRRYDAGYGVKTFDALSQVVAFFEERRGRLYGFRWRDRLDHSSAAPGVSIRPTDQIIGTGDGVTATFQLADISFALPNVCFRIAACDPKQTSAPSMYRPQITSHRATIVGRDLTQFSSEFGGILCKFPC